MFRGLDKNPAAYDILTVNMFVYGFMKSMDKVKEPKSMAVCRIGRLGSCEMEPRGDPIVYQTQRLC